MVTLWNFLLWIFQYYLKQFIDPFVLHRLAHEHLPVVVLSVLIINTHCFCDVAVYTVSQKHPRHYQL